MKRNDDSVMASLQQVAGTPYTDADYNKDLIDLYLLRKARQKGIRLPTGGPPDEYKYLGAHVFQSTAGTSENVTYIDVGSMYPSLLMSLNASPETLIGTREDLKDSQYTEDDCVWGYVDTRPVKHIESGESWRQYTNGQYKMVYDPQNNDMKWSCDDGNGVRYEKLYFLSHEVQKGFLTECVEELIDLKNQYRGTSLYASTKTVTNCFTPDTEVLTPDGVVNIRDLNVGDSVYSFNPDTEEVETKPVTETFSYPNYDGDLLNFETSHIDFSITPNHRMIARKDNPSPQSTTWDEYKFVEAGEMEDYSHYELPHNWDIEHGEEIDVVNLTEWIDDYEVWFNHGDTHGHTVRHNVNGAVQPSQRGVKDSKRDGYRVEPEVYEQNKEYIHEIAEEVCIHKDAKQKWIPVEYDGDDFIQFLAWFITEGSTRVHGGDKEKYDTTRGYTHEINIAQRNDGGRSDISQLLERMNLDGYTDDRGFSLSSEILLEILHDLCGDNSFNKHIPDLIYECSEHQKQMFFETLIKGDGDSSDTSHRYTTSSDELRDDFMRLCVHLGRNPRYRRDSGSWRIHYSQTKNTFRPNRSREKSEADNGVYCVEVEDNHTLLAGRNGNFQFVGQSIYGVLGYANSDSSFRLFDWRLAEAITLCGRKMIQHSADYVLEYLAERGHDDAYVALGDTDGCGIALPSVSTRHEALSIIEEAVEQLNNDGYDQFFADEFGVDPDDHHGVIEVESYAPKVFIPARDPPHGEVGVKKRRIEWQTWEEDDGQIDDISITGLEAERSDVAPITKDAQIAFAETVREDTSTAKEQLFPYLREQYAAIQDGSIELSKVCKRGGIGQNLFEYGTANRRPAPIYRGAKYANNHIDGITVQHGDKPAVIFVKKVTGEYPNTYSAETAEGGDVVDAVALPDPAKLPNGFVVDYEKHCEKVLLDPMEPLLNTRFGEDTWQEIIHQHEQRGIESFAD